MPETLFSSRILIVDDEFSNVLLIETVLHSAGYTNISTTTDSMSVVRLCEQETPDLILLDLMMPGIDGYEVMARLQPLLQAERYLPILVLTANTLPEVKHRALSAGAKDFLGKPFDIDELLLRVRNLLETRSLYTLMQSQNRALEERVAHHTRELSQSNKTLRNLNNQLENSQIEVLTRLAQATELRDDDTGQHTQRVAHLAASLAAYMNLQEEQVELIRRAALLHDVGKIGVSDSLLLKPSRLTTEEFESVKMHTTLGAALLADGVTPEVQLAQQIALTHHECWNGSGYPQGLCRNEIPLESRILAVVDVFDALTHDRPYKKAWSTQDALREIANCSGSQFDPLVVNSFLEMLREQTAQPSPIATQKVEYSIAAAHASAQRAPSIAAETIPPA